MTEPWQFMSECPYNGPRCFEVPYVINHLIPGASIEIGGNQSLFKWALIRRGEKFTLIDPLGTKFNNGANHRLATCLKGDIRSHTPQQLGKFNNVLLVSVLEHISLPAYGQKKDWSGSPRKSQLKAFNHCLKFIKPGGRIIVTLPHTTKDEETDPKFALRYNRDMLDDLQKGHKVIDEKFFIMEKPQWMDRWQEVPESQTIDRRSNVCFTLSLCPKSIKLFVLLWSYKCQLERQ